MLSAVPRRVLLSGRRSIQQVRFGSHAAHDAHHAPAVPESFGKGFYMSIAAFTGLCAFYKFTVSDEKEPLVTRIINKYHSQSALWEARNTVHTKMVEEAAHDRLLFEESPIPKSRPYAYPEALNQGSPWNITAGWATGDLTAVKAHMEAERARLDALRQGN
ncbi:NADH-ubiquinone oxidoreductase [Pyronema domesticum]|uniref:Similar to NADH-ubiquinone oxidoreductase 17.8 kDa subunit, mitochondrial acc. no. P42116 n=1 Tax=Pyronema omphalodes (strain CBS 100304) TaxID=1076935 RepID=U4L2V6_PYROM|nr:NADH-ubiquinone oxidoreductase [Pyronema domesticum]CCX09680.1 Similar to NADH-ubiquinone oxidoreductase 17.8 kDa subunit, mitochondrial; acc. no. P42116 [Pyronema omphalodes CBS 100304]